MKFHLPWFSLTLSDLERSIQVTGFQWPISPNLVKITTELLLMMDRKSCMRFHLAPLVTMTGQIEVRHISEGRNLVTLADTAKFIIND